MNIRPARLQDSKRIAVLHRSVALAVYQSPDLLAALQAITLEQATVEWQQTINHANAVVYVATGDRKLIGFASALRVPRPLPVEVHPAPSGALLDHVYVRDGYRRSDVGRRLVLRVVWRLRFTHQIQAMHAWTYADNASGQAFCQGLGGQRREFPAFGMVLFDWKSTAKI
jgi:GNAT superfamily N-acetyltransferase